VLILSVVFFDFLRSTGHQNRCTVNDIFIVLCYYFKWYTVLLDIFCSSLLPSLVCGVTTIRFLRSIMKPPLKYLKLLEFFCQVSNAWQSEIPFKCTFFNYETYMYDYSLWAVLVPPYFKTSKQQRNVNLTLKQILTTLLCTVGLRNGGFDQCGVNTGGYLFIYRYIYYICTR